MIQGLSASASKVAALALLALVMAAFWVVAIEPLSARITAADDEIAQSRRLKGALIERARQLRDEQDSAPIVSDAAASAQTIALIEGATRAQVTAALQGRIGDAAGKAGTTLVSTSIVPDRQSGRLRLAAIEAVMRGEIAPLERFLYDIETGSPTLVVLDIEVSRSPVPETPPREVSLDIRIVIGGAVAEAAAGSDATREPLDGAGTDGEALP